MSSLPLTAKDPDMPVTATYPGVYIEELSSGVHTITGVATSVAAFVGATSRGPTDGPVHITSFADFQRTFGEVTPDSPVSQAVYQFYLNGGSEAEVVRLSNGAAATISLDGVPLVAKGPGAWGNSLRVRVDYDTATGPPSGGADATSYNLTALDTTTGTREAFLNVSTIPTAARSLANVLAGSTLLALPATGAVQDKAPGKHADIPLTDPDQNPFSDAHADRYTQGSDGTPGGTPGANDYNGGSSGQADKKGIYQLLKTDIFNLLCLPGAPASVLSVALQLCVDRRAVLLVDPPPAWTTVATAVSGMASPPVSGDGAKNAVVYFPRLQIPDPVQSGVTRTVDPCGTLAGVMARTDVQRGVWKAPAGTAASLSGVLALDVPMTDLENGQLNKLGVNCLRIFPVIGPVSWGARTLRGADRIADEWKYLPVRRLALFIEESLFRGTQWVVFEPNDEPLWASIRMNVGAFMNGLFRQGAFQGVTAREAYLVKCDKENNPQNDIDQGIVNILVGFAPLKPAEFVIIHIQQLAGQLQT
jgi:phage tail sheath protein FI